ncbi:MAG: hypothetical protein GY816_00935 [Cytophagales bacterium]|nr:hypothetical protein [Cytophagales bacterium]
MVEKSLNFWNSPVLVVTKSRILVANHNFSAGELEEIEDFFDGMDSDCMSQTDPNLAESNADPRGQNGTLKLTNADISNQYMTEMLNESTQMNNHSEGTMERDDNGKGTPSKGRRNLPSCESLCGKKASVILGD